MHWVPVTRSIGAAYTHHHQKIPEEQASLIITLHLEDLLYCSRNTNKPFRPFAASTTGLFQRWLKQVPLLVCSQLQNKDAEVTCI